LHQSIAGEHIRSASYLLRYRTSSSSFVARPVVVSLEQIPATDSGVEGSSSESNIPITDLMKKRKVPSFFVKSASAIEEAKKLKKDAPGEGSKKTKVLLPSAAREVTRKPPVASSKTEASKKPPMAPSKTVAATSSGDVVVISPERTTSLIEDVPAPLKRLKKTFSQPSNVEGETVSLFVPPSSVVGLVKSWTIPDVQDIETNFSREKLTILAAQHITSVSILI